MRVVNKSYFLTRIMIFQSITNIIKIHFFIFNYENLDSMIFAYKICKFIALLFMHCLKSLLSHNFKLNKNLSIF